MKATNKQNNQAWFKAACIAIILSLSTYSFAQPPGGGGGGRPDGPPPVPSQEQVEEMVNDLDTELSLSNEQEEQVLDIFTDHFDEVRAKTSGNSRPDRNEMEALKSSLDSDMEKVLTDDQFKDYQKYSKKNKQKRQ